MLRLKPQYFSHMMLRTDSLEKTLMLRKIEGRRRRQQRMRWLNGITNLMDKEFEQIPGVGYGQEILECFSPWVCKELDTAEWLNWTEVNISCKESTVNDWNSMDLSEAEDIKRWKEYSELYKKYLNDPDNHNGVITHLEPDILACQVKWALGSITINKASGDDWIPVDIVKVLHSIRQQIWKIKQWQQDWKRSVFTPIPKKGNVKRTFSSVTQ